MVVDPARPDYAESAAVLVGVSAYQDPVYQDPGHGRLVSATNSMAAIQGLLSDPELCGWPPERIVPIIDPASAAELAVRLKEIARQTSDTLLLYYVGHGELTATGELVLTVTSTQAADPKETGLRYDLVRDAFNASTARMKVAFLDCCGAGRAIPTVLGPSTVAQRAAVEGTYILTAATGNSDAHRPLAAVDPAAPTSFTAALSAVVRRGIAGKPDWLTLPDFFPELSAWLRERGLPEPGQAISAIATEFLFARNAAPPEDRCDPAAEITRLQTELAALTSREDVHIAQLADLAQTRQQVNDLSEERRRQDAKLADLRSEVAQLRDRLRAQAAEADRLRHSEQQQRQIAEELQRKVLRARAEADRLEARIAELAAESTSGRDGDEWVLDDEDPAPSPPAASTGRARVYYREPAWWSRWGMRLWCLFLLGPLYALARTWLTGELSVIGMIGVAVGAVAIAYIPSMILYFSFRDQIRITDQAMYFFQCRYSWDQIGRLSRISNLTNIAGVPNARVVSCSKCGKPTSPSVPALVIYDIDGAEITDVNLTHLANPGCFCSMVDGIRMDGSPEPVYLRFLDKGWERFRDTVSAAAPHVIVDDFDPPQSVLLKRLDTPTK